MGYKVDWKPKPLKYLHSLSSKESSRIIDKVDEILTNPFRYLKHYEGSNLYKIRIGNFRLLVDMLHDKKLLVIQVLDKRGRVYKR